MVVEETVEVTPEPAPAPAPEPEVKSVPKPKPKAKAKVELDPEEERLKKVAELKKVKEEQQEKDIMFGLTQTSFGRGKIQFKRRSRRQEQ